VFAFKNWKVMEGITLSSHADSSGGWLLGPEIPDLWRKYWNYRVSDCNCLPSLDLQSYNSDIQIPTQH
jgi:hypothetical protein